MGFFRNVFRSVRRRQTVVAAPAAHGADSYRRCHVEEMEERQLMAADIHIGAVYYDPAGGQDKAPNTSTISWNGGADGTQLTHLQISTDKLGTGRLDDGNPFFNVSAGAPGVYGYSPFQVVAGNGSQTTSAGLQVTNVSVVNGGLTLDLDFSGFTAGKSLVFTIDVDQMNIGGADAIVDGFDFAGSKLSATFQNPHYADFSGTARFYDRFDQYFAGSDLNLPADSYDPPNTTPSPVLTAGAIISGAQEALPSSISGIVYDDRNLDNMQEPGEAGIAGVAVALQVWNGAQYVDTGMSTTTDAGGAYHFTNLQPGQYQVVKTRPAGYLDVGASAGRLNGQTDGAVFSADVITTVVVAGNDNSIDNDFAEALPGKISGYVYYDANNNGQKDVGEAGIADTVVDLFNAQQQKVASTTTDATGFYQFTGLTPSSYTVEEEPPAGYLPGKDAVGSAGGTLASPADITNISLLSGTVGTDYDFGHLLPGTISGLVYVDANGDHARESAEPVLPGVTIQLLGASNQVIATTTTDQNGQYVFNNLAPLSTYTLHEVQPVGYFETGASLGTAGGTLDGLDTMGHITLASGTSGADYDFFVAQPASLDGMVLVDTKGNCAYTPGEPVLAGVTIQLLNAQNQVVASTVTNAQGKYSFTDLSPGTYTVYEAQPTGYIEIGAIAGSAGGTVAGNDTIAGVSLGSGAFGMCYDFFVQQPASLDGMVLVDTTGNCTYTPGEPVLAGVTIELLNAQNQVVASTVTNAQGQYSFANLLPGTYTVHEAQPVGYLETGASAGSSGGTVSGHDTIGNVTLASGGDGMCYDFFVQQPAQISGIAYVDFNGDQQHEAGEQLLSGVTIQLLNAANQVVATTVTDTNGSYSFTGLSPGTYTVHELKPSGYLAYGDTVGSAGGTAADVDALANVTLASGTNGTDYDFWVRSVTGIITSSEFAIPSLQPMANPPTPIIVTPLLQSDVPRQVMNFYYGGGYASGNTWHLSVIDAGEPRGAGGAPQVAMISMKSDPFQAPNEDVHSSEWVLGEGLEGENGPRLVRFGMRNGRPITGDFNGDGVTDVGFFLDGQWYIDLNSNGKWDEGDLWARLGHEGDLPVTGDWDGDGKTDIGIFGRAWPGDPAAIDREPGLPAPQNVLTGRKKNVPPRNEEAALGRRTLRHTSTGPYRADVIDHVFHYGTAGDIPITGDWHGTGVHTIGLFYKGHWILDANGDGRATDADHDFFYGAEGDLPIVGDFNGDGIDELGVYRKGTWYIDTNNDRVLDVHDKHFQLGGPHDVPVVGDWNGDGVDEPGLYHEGAPTNVAAAPAAPGAPTTE